MLVGNKDSNKELEEATGTSVPQNKNSEDVQGKIQKRRAVDLLSFNDNHAPLKEDQEQFSGTR